MLAEVAAAQARDEHAPALARLASAAERVPEESSILAALGWARIRASSWCAANYPLRDDAEFVGSRTAIDGMCSAASRQQGLRDLRDALRHAETDASRAHIRTRLAQALHAMDLAKAVEHARIALCLMSGDGETSLRSAASPGPDAEAGASANDEARQLYASLLWAQGERAARADDIAGAMVRFAQSMEVRPDPGREETLARWRRAWSRPFAWAPFEGPLPPAHEDLDSLCGVFGARGVPESCALDVDWHAAAGSSFELALLGVVPPGAPPGDRRDFHLVARTPRGVFDLGVLGSRHRGSRRIHGVFSLGSLRFLTGLPFPAGVVEFVRGEAHADGCDWVERSEGHMWICALEAGQPRCFAQARLGPRRYRLDRDDDTMLPTVAEALGQCEAPGPGPALSVWRFASRFRVLVGEREIVVEQEPYRTRTCSPTRATLCAVRGAPHACTSPPP